MSPRAAVIWRFGLENLLPRWLTHTADTLVLAVVRQPQYLAPKTSPKGHVSVLITGQLPFSRVSDPRESKVESMSFMNQPQKSQAVVSALSYWLQSSALHTEGGGGGGSGETIQGHECRKVTITGGHPSLATTPRYQLKNWPCSPSQNYCFSFFYMSMKSANFQVHK